MLGKGGGDPEANYCQIGIGPDRRIRTLRTRADLRRTDNTPVRLGVIIDRDVRGERPAKTCDKWAWLKRSSAPKTCRLGK